MLSADFSNYNMLTLDSIETTMEGLDLAINNDNYEQTTDTRTATFTLSSSTSSSLSSSLSNLPLTDVPTRPSFSTVLFEDHELKHSQSLTLECQRRRPVIEDPYKVTPNLEVLNDWMIVS